MNALPAVELNDTPYFTVERLCIGGLRVRLAVRTNTLYLSDSEARQLAAQLQALLPEVQA